MRPISLWLYIGSMAISLQERLLEALRFGEREYHRLLALVLAVDAAAVVALAALPAEGLRERAGTMLLLAVLTALAGARPVRIAALRTEVTATHPFILCALATAGPQAAGLVALTGVLGAAAGQTKRRKGIRFAFNLGAVVLSAALASWAFLFVGGTPGDRVATLIGPLMAATVAYFFANTGLVAAVIALEKGQRFTATWKRSFGWTTVSYFAGLTLAVGLLVVLETLGALGAGLRDTTLLAPSGFEPEMERTIFWHTLSPVRLITGRVTCGPPSS